MQSNIKVKSAFCIKLVNCLLTHVVKFLFPSTLPSDEGDPCPTPVDEEAAALPPEVMLLSASDPESEEKGAKLVTCLLYTSDAADE